MSLFGIFKKKKEKIAKKRPSLVKARQAQERKEEIKVEPVKQKKKIPGFAYGILDSPQITEKASYLAKGNQYVFKVWPRANKTEIRKAVQDLYGVDVTAVKIINIPKKQRRLGRQIGWRKGYKKAVVEIKEGQKIEILPR